MTAKKRVDDNVTVTISKLAQKNADSNTRRADSNIRRTDINIAAIANKTTTVYVNVMAINAKADANVVVNANTNKAFSNIKEHMSTYWQPQMPM